MSRKFKYRDVNGSVRMAQVLRKRDEKRENRRSQFELSAAELQAGSLFPEKAMATHSSVLAWRVPGMGEPDGLPSMGSHRVGHDGSDLAAAAAAVACFLGWQLELFNNH